MQSLTKHYVKCLIYARVSTGVQAERQLSIPAQLAAMRQHANQQGWQVLEEYLEAGMSGRSTGRPELTKLLARCREEGSGIDVVLVHKLDRLARNLADHVAIRSYLAKAKIRLLDNASSKIVGSPAPGIYQIANSVASAFQADL